MTTVDRVAYAILKSIETGHLKEGEILPTERDLAKKYAVNRSTIREAMKILEIFRYVHKTSGVGSVVLPQNNWSYESLIFKYNFANRIEPSTASDFVELLIIVEQACANIAFNRKTIRDVRHLEDLYEKLLSSQDPSEQDKKIHLYFAKLSENVVYFRLISSIWVPIKKYSYLYHTSNKSQDAKKLLKDIILSFKNNKKRLPISIANYYHDALYSLLRSLSASD